VSAGRKPRGGVSFTVVEGGRDLHRQPVVPRDERPPCIGCYVVASAVAACVVAGALWIGAMTRWVRL
jgi:hypothetical protein